MLPVLETLIFNFAGYSEGQKWKPVLPGSLFEEFQCRNEGEEYLDEWLRSHAVDYTMTLRPNMVNYWVFCVHEFEAVVFICEHHRYAGSENYYQEMRATMYD